ncbi:hypothetical protein SAMN04488570_0250 [Nocardioides scoriae]|uniref:Uncharacterized protein n=1 Tax=Nocardioides scoriae TaxID=642780 RepID=A0A1H1LJY3_9ACTN|nr:hypothetical protein [Nocardioides scoriae]SDR74853.1 hypothetical protein SAMN04488570_0250 [Nocardioides scoriae]
MDAPIPEGDEQTRDIANVFLDVLATLDPDTDPSGELLQRLLPDVQRHLVDAGAIIAEVDTETGAVQANPTALVATVLALLEIFLTFSTLDTDEDRLVLIHRAREHVDAVFGA